MANTAPDLATEWAASAHNRIGDSPPIDVRAACRSVQLYVRSEDMHEDTRGFLLRTQARWYAVINARLPIERQRWALAHELCEYLFVRRLESQGKAFQPRDRVECEHDGHERLCDRFAANLLMPESQVRKFAAELHHSRRNNKTAVLASRFGVSDQAMRLRLREIGL